MGSCDQTPFDQNPFDQAPFDQARATYDAVAEDYARYFPTTEPEDPLDLALIDDFVRRVGPGARVLDAGCGSGRMGRYLSDRGLAVRGVDLSPGMISMARRHHPDLDVSVASITDLPFADDDFDAGFYWYSIIHAPDDQLGLIFDEASRVITKSGLILVAFQGGDGVRDVASGFRDLGHDVRLDRYHRSADQVAAALAAAGFAEVARLVRQPSGSERDPQVFLLARGTSRTQ